MDDVTDPGTAGSSHEHEHVTDPGAAAGSEDHPVSVTRALTVADVRLNGYTVLAAPAWAFVVVLGVFGEPDPRLWFSLIRQLRRDAGHEYARTPRRLQDATGASRAHWDPAVEADATTRRAARWHVATVAVLVLWADVLQPTTSHRLLLDSLCGAGTEAPPPISCTCAADDHVHGLSAGVHPNATGCAHVLTGLSATRVPGAALMATATETVTITDAITVRIETAANAILVGVVSYRTESESEATRLVVVKASRDVTVVRSSILTEDVLVVDRPEDQEDEFVALHPPELFLRDTHPEPKRTFDASADGFNDLRRTAFGVAVSHAHWWRRCTGRIDVGELRRGHVHRRGSPRVLNDYFSGDFVHRPSKFWQGRATDENPGTLVESKRLSRILVRFLSHSERLSREARRLLRFSDAEHGETFGLFPTGVGGVFADAVVFAQRAEAISRESVGTHDFLHCKVREVSLRCGAYRNHHIQHEQPTHSPVYPRECCGLAARLRGKTNVVLVRPMRYYSGLLLFECARIVAFITCLQSEQFYTRAWDSAVLSAWGGRKFLFCDDF